MTDENHFIEITPEELARRRDLQNAALEDRSHRFDRLMIETLNMDDLATLGELLGIIVNSEEPQVVAAYYQGTINSILKIKYGMCPGCGGKHTTVEDFLIDTARVGEDVEAIISEAMKKDPAEDHPMDTDKEYEYERELFEWDLKQSGLGLYCVGCGKQYPSLEDRKRRPKGIDGCHGCQERSAHG